MGVCNKIADPADWERNSAPRDEPGGALTVRNFFPSLEMNEVNIVSNQLE